MTDSGAVPTLRAVFRAEIEGHRALLSVLIAEQEALRTANAEAVAIAASSKLRHINELEALARQRMELVIGMGIALTATSVETGTLAAPAAAQLKSDWAALRAVASEAQQTNALNGRLIERHQRHCETALAALLQAGGRTAVYGADGRPERTSIGRPLVAI
ncbi:MAG TPA: flagellar protein FlgN [Casimicrobiaceae bacterium]|nr:flagellar protein FlgN [Casimicrobiaceae bacterium]